MAWLDVTLSCFSLDKYLVLRVAFSSSDSEDGLLHTANRHRTTSHHKGKIDVGNREFTTLLQCLMQTCIIHVGTHTQSKVWLDALTWPSVHIRS